MPLIIMRHGQSVANQDNIFTGWLDVPLTDFGIEQARQVGQKLAAKNISIDEAFTSVLNRAILSTDIVLEELGQLYVPVCKLWRLNERHYGEWQGQNKAELGKQYGPEVLERWRRSYDVVPPLSKTLPKERRYQHIDPKLLPYAESLADTEQRIIPCWQDRIAPLLKAQKTVLIVSHGNSLRALIKVIENISDQEISKVAIQTGEAIKYEFDENLTITGKEKL